METVPVFSHTVIIRQCSQIITYYVCNQVIIGCGCLFATVGLRNEEEMAGRLGQCRALTTGTAGHVASFVRFGVCVLEWHWPRYPSTP